MSTGFEDSAPAPRAVNCYIHVPFCRSRCGYCAFYSQTGGDRSAWLARTVSDISEYSAVCPPVATVYIGGGTPTLLVLEELERLTAAVEKLPLLPEAELSIEANPETLDSAKVDFLRRHYSRISLGVQSFSASFRDYLGRDCSESALEKAVSLVRRAGFKHWNCDLIYGMAGQTEEDFASDVLRAAECGADHVSCYSLTCEENSRLGGELRTVSDELAVKMWDAAAGILNSFGIRRYEISNYAGAGCECRHNVNVWRGGILRGFGPSAAGFDGVDRFTEPPSLADWLSGVSPEYDRIPHWERLNEIFAVNLRTCAGWTPELWAGVPGADAWQNRLASAGRLPSEWIEISEERITLTRLGLLFWNSAAERLIFD